MLRSWREKLGEKCPLSTLDYSVLRIFSLDIFLEIPKLAQAQKKANNCHRKTRKGEKGEAKK